MTTPSAKTVTDYLDRLAEPHRADARELDKLIRTAEQRAGTGSDR